MKRHLLKYSLLLLPLLVTLQANAESINMEKETDIKHLLDMTGTLAIGKQMSGAAIAQMSRSLKAARPDLPQELFDVMEEEVNQVIDENLPAFVAVVVPIYDKHFTHQEIKGLLAFYRTELGQKMIRVTPFLLRESRAAGLQWGQSLGPELQRRIIERFKKEGIDLST
jgi:hypothetical protein